MLSVNKDGKFSIWPQDKVAEIIGNIHKSPMISATYIHSVRRTHTYVMEGDRFKALRTTTARLGRYIYVVDGSGNLLGSRDIVLLASNDREAVNYLRRKELGARGDIYIYKYDAEQDVWSLRGIEVVKRKYCVLFPHPTKKKKKRAKAR